MEEKLRRELVMLLSGGNAHMSLKDATSDFPKSWMNKAAPNVEYTFWQLLEHIRIGQKDILDYILQKNYKPLEWPKDYWPVAGVKASTQMWNKTLESIQSDNKKLLKLVTDKKLNLFKLCPNNQTILHELIT